MTDLTILYGSKKAINSQSIHLLNDLVDNYVEQHEHDRILHPVVLDTLRNVYQWLEDNEISGDDAMLGYYAFKRMQTFDTSVRYYLHLDREEHRTLFLLCKENIMYPQEETA
jgi:hypothetical protein